MSANLVILMGNLTRDPELKYTPRGVACASFGLAVNKVWFNGQGEKQEKVAFFDITAWDKGAEWAANYLIKGSSIHIEGELDQQTWEDKQTGDKRSKVCVIARKLTPCFATWKGDGRAARDEDAQHTASPGKPKPQQHAPAGRQTPQRPPADPDLDVDGDDGPF